MNETFALKRYSLERWKFFCFCAKYFRRVNGIMTNEQMNRCQEKRNKLQEQQVEIYPESYKINHELSELASLDDGTQNIKVAGRILTMRKFSKLIFVHLADVNSRFQVLLTEQELGETSLNQFRTTIDIGDFIGVHGSMYTTNSGEKTLRATDYQFLGKALRPLPEKWHGLTDTETRYRQRYLDLLMTEATKEQMLLRIQLIREIRHFLEAKNFLEVETPILQHTSSGAIAKPFHTHHNALDIELNLRIAPETYLKRLIVGGFTKIFEFAKSFRNEGISPQHLQEFTMVEGYAAYWNYQDSMVLMRKLILHVLENVFHTATIKIGESSVNFAEDWAIVSFRELLLKDTGIDIDQFPQAKELYEEIVKKGIHLKHEDIHSLGRGNLIDLLYKKVSRPHIVKPTFLIQHPIDLSPLARSNDQDPALTDRFQLIVNGAEIINGYSELVDPIEQRERLLKQAQLKADGDTESMEMDEDYLLAMEYGLPPISGWGFSIERLLMVLTDSDTIKETVLFPLVRK
ncbi:lysine-tRNA ligase [Enterococcus sp. DIV0840]